MTVIPGVPAASAAKPQRSVEVYDFSRPTTLAREHSRVLEMAFETFARQWGTQLTAKVRVKTQVTSEQVLMQTYDDYAASLPSTTAMVLCTVDGLDAKGVIQFPIPAALTLVVNMLGGHSGQPVPDRPFTPIEQGLVRRLMEDALEDLRYSFGSLLSRAVSVGAIQYNSQFAQAAAPSDLMIVATFTVTVGEAAADATIAVPAEVLMPQLGPANSTASAADAKHLIREQLGSVPVDVSLQLTPAVVKPAEILNLAVGDVLALPHPTHHPFDVTVDGHRLAQASAGTNGSRLAAVIVTTEEKTR
ncbi:flagellar motor switch protein FliM [Paenarthrobacter sp. DKR-5]|uniref:flagellar motor switch protein FliM n=1 Tax=Paenarthrobacter sp. DKR-5 TaxID=2835535 RepID=UPI0027DDA0FD|nr:flagellar motor switch protein FliM [Paenarthrobacter sp. DKR-5]